MTQQNPSDPQNTLKELILQFGKLPALLAFAGLVFVGGIVILMITGQSTNWPWVLALTGIASFLAYEFMNRWFNLQETKLKSENHADESEEALPPPPEESEPKAQASDPPPLDANELEKLYLRNLREQCGYVSTAIFATAKAHQNKHSNNTLKLDAVFTNLDVPSIHKPEDGDRNPRQSVLSRLNEHKKFVLLGKAGSGKSTLVNYITLCLSGEKLNEADFNRLTLAESGWKLPALMPVRIILRDYAARGLPVGQSLWAFIKDELKGLDDDLTAYAPHLEKLLKKDGGLLLLDGYDEVPEAYERRDQLKKAIQTFHTHFPKVRIIVTTRPYAYGNDTDWQLPGFAHAELLDFTSDQIAEYVQRWYQAVAEADPTLKAEHATTYTKQLQAEVGEHGRKGVRELAERPLLLTLICSLHRAWGGRPLPNERHALYEASVTLLLNLWEQPKMATDREGNEAILGPTLKELHIDDPKKLRIALNKIAYEVHAAQPKNAKETADIPEHLLTTALINIDPTKQIQYKDIAAYLKNRTGLITDRGPAKDENKRINDTPSHIYTFPHRTFQEYLAACHLMAKMRPRDIANLARNDHSRWRETLLLVAGRNDIDHQVWKLVSELCPDSWLDGQINVANETWQGAFLAGLVLLEKEWTAPAEDKENEKIRKRVQAWHMSIMSRGPLPMSNRAEASVTLAALGDDRPGVLHCDEMRFCTVPAGDFWLEDWSGDNKDQWYTALNQPYWMAELPVTVAHFREFVADSGHNPRDRDSLIGADNLPVIWVNWYDSLVFCDWLNDRWQARGWLPMGYRVTLPSEVEWEKAARGGRFLPPQQQILTAAQLQQAAQTPLKLNTQEQPLAKRAYPWGNEPEQEKVSNGTILHRANNKTAGIGRRSSVGAFPAGRSPVGCLDMSGNVWEWTRSLHEKSFPPQLTKAFETSDSRNKENMVLRGGAFYQKQNLCSARLGGNPRYVFNYNLGLRVVVSPFLSAL